jgi:hypothetical protein
MKGRAAHPRGFVWMCKQSVCGKRGLQEPENKGVVNRCLAERVLSERGIPPPPAFCTKRLQAAENKGRELRKERQEISRGCKLLNSLELQVE